MSPPAVTIGLIADSTLNSLLRALTSLERNTPEPCRLVLIEDGPDTETSRYLRRLNAHEVVGHAYPKGFAACANRLIDLAHTPYLMVLRDDCYVTPGWLSTLLDALGRHPDLGIVGPSTSIAGNEQRVVAEPDWTPAQIEAYAGRVHRRYGARVEPLDELHTVSDFCFCFTREVVDRIGYFDEAYGLGPFAEIDYGTRAARAGLGCAWARGA
jgi:O-antigen biosynthesis protein